ncbi:Polysaccharide pyruvyl transferase [Halanaerobium congolense]|nr:Polysaccharide pyruvyl transferase [Halanaerobium congolense]SDN12260.1 Polysaccharide pyruvyl transferase [Halanaerobium congolense]
MTSQNDIMQINEMNFDAVIVGSDQVWRVENTSGVGNNFFLDFIKDNNIKKLSYAASFGIDDINCSSSQLKEINSLIDDFDAVSVREESGVDICKNKFNISAVRLLDPTMLLEKSDYLDLVNEEVKFDNKLLTTYVLDKTDERKKIINKISNKKDLKINPVNTELKSFDIKNLLLNIDKIILPSIEQWIKGFSEADFIVTDSFHGTLFSILFNKQFVSIGNKRRGLTRFKSILKIFDLEDRLILSSDDLNDDLLNREIDYNRINKIINKEREKSFNFLKKNI